MGFLDLFRKKKKNTDDEFNANRYQGRLEGLSWCILETRSPEYDPDKMKEKPSALWLLEAFNLASNEEKEVLKKLMNIIKEKQPTTDSSDKDKTFTIYAKGAVEGKCVIYDHKMPSCLLKEEKV